MKYEYRTVTLDDGTTYQVPKNNPTHCRRDSSTRYLFWKRWQLVYKLPVPDAVTGKCPGFEQVFIKYIAKLGI